MFRYFAMTATIAAGAVLIACPHTAHAAPGDTAGHCSWNPVAPTVITVSNVKMVAASLQLGECTVYGNPNLETVCLSMKGEDSPPKCEQSASPFKFEVLYPYRPGATYVMTGRGCMTLFEPPFRLCQDYGPVTYTL